MRPRLALVPGEPAGVGPELCVRALHRAHEADIVVFGDRATLARAADAIGMPPPEFVDAGDARATAPGRARIIDVPAAAAAEFGHPDPRNTPAVIAALERAAAACIAGELDGLVTGPVHKAAINAGGIAYTGTTGLLAAQAGRDVVMMLANDI